ncbi:unnamed protein product [Brachionus calyciflorus]|uniref:BOD1/SHG1 domain-containing protein n=1 Tax=Brachionus calyciflorus TaxID=104777 RepID=A0A814KKA9_9BILA|nr:unnamed protein product [Brachionus calyciflorus]
MESFNSSSDSNLRPIISDVIREFKAAGHFDRLRKDCFNEIVSQKSFQNLNKNIEDYVKRFLGDQERLGANLKKNDIREMLKRKLYENQAFNNEITMFISQAIDSKTDTGLKPIIDSMVEKITKPHEPEPEIRSTPENPSFIPEHVAFTPVQDLKPTPPPPPPPPPQQPQKAPPIPQPAQPIQPKISVEDFLSLDSKPSTSTKLTTQVKTEKIRKLSESEKQVTKQIVPKIEKESNENLKKDEKSTTSKAVTKPQVTKPTQQAQVKKVIKTTSTKEIDTLTRRISLNAETNLEPDPTHEYNFDWKLDQIDSKIFDEISVSSVNTSDLSDFSDIDDLN